MELLTTMPLSLMQSLSPFTERCVVFIATDLPLILTAAVVIFILFRTIPNTHPFSRIENMYARTKQLATVLFGSIGTLVVATEAKIHLAVPRPFLQNSDIHTLITETDFSFPSSHASLFAFIAVWMFSIDKRAGTALSVSALAIGTARVLAGVHTPLDILCGYLLGIGAALIVILVTRHLELRAVREEN